MEAKTHRNTLNSEWMDFQLVHFFCFEYGHIYITSPTFLGIWISFDMAGDMEWLMRLQNVYHVLTIPQSAGKQWKTTLGRYMFFSFWDPCETTM